MIQPKKDFKYGNYLIVGQGIAGTALHFSLLQKGVKSFVVDDFHHKASSLVAAGMYNPLVFRRLTDSWKVDKLLPFLDVFYKDMEDFLGVKFHHKLKINKIFTSQEEENMWLEKIDVFKELIHIDFSQKKINENINSPFGFGEVKNGGWVDLKKMLHSYRDYLKKEKLMIEEAFDYNALAISKDKTTYKEEKFDKVIFCEGHQVVNNPYFNHLPLNISKGEVLEVKFEELKFDSVLNKGFFMMPYLQDIVKVGSTYTWNDENSNPTEEARNELTNKIKSITNSNFHIHNQEAGIRPTVKDRRPLIGKSEDHDNLFIFNGMGTKGVMIAPFYATQFAEFIIEGKSIDQEVNINRF